MREQGAVLSAAERQAVAEYLSGRKFGASMAADAPACARARPPASIMREPPAFTGWGLDPAGTHAVPARVSGIDTGNVGGLKLKWAFGFPNSSRARSHPVVAGGAILVGNHNGSVYALDRETGCVRWAFAAEAEVRTGIVVSPWRAGDPAARPLVHFGDVAGNAYGVNLRTARSPGKSRRRPSRRDRDRHADAVAGHALCPGLVQRRGLRHQPRLSCCDFRGSVLALDAATGQEKWRT